MNFILEAIIIAILTLAMLFDLYSQFIRANISAKGTSQLIGKSNWVQYQARILTMLSVVLLTYCYEKNIISFDINSLLSAAFLVSGIFGIFYIKNKSIFYAFNSLLDIPTYFTFSKFYKEKYSIRTTLKLDKIFLSSFAVNLAINSAIVIPFILAEKYPDMRMTSAYVGQLLNFFGSIINFNLIEPAFYRALDAKTEQVVASQIIYSKILSNILVAAVMHLAALWQ